MRGQESRKRIKTKKEDGGRRRYGGAANIAPNPFIQQPFGVVNPQQVAVNSDASCPHVAGTWNNPFVMPLAQTRYGADTVHGAGGVARQNNIPNWNPFV
ncbi:hypothetical protein TELCIR_07024 [Teladorsagia circumcincta]|uniref:Uncharacterized protein n=1 Tax=Teladorsagia circumcincta TaxID=45464 RepID=A0A2G9ULR5_TELCI|nr:hypothetical protein TELCIR_07024 [Teladorsagia circumcincta]